MSYNPLLPMAELALAEVSARGSAITASALREVMRENERAEFAALDTLVAKDRLETLAISRVLKAYGPAYESADGMEHADATADYTLEIAERILALHERDVAAREARLAEWRNRVASIRLRDGLDAGVPVEDSETVTP
jgi:hypothetical protein